MKQELTIAFCLLAAGVIFWGWQFNGWPSGATTEFRYQQRQENLNLSEASDNGQFLGRVVKQASYPAVQRDQPASGISSFLNVTRSVSDFRSDGTTADRADLMLRRARYMINDGPAFESGVSVQATLFGQTVRGSGNYVQTGQGRGKTRTTLVFHTPSTYPATGESDSAPQHKVTNLCDGRFVYRLHEDLLNNEQSLEFYDLQQIKNTESKRKHNFGNRQPRIPLAPGELISSGLTGLLQHLADEFRFAIVDQDSGQSVQKHLLRGTWKPDRLNKLLRDHLTPGQMKSGLAWSQLPPNLPHAVELTLIETSTWELFPAQLVFYQFQKQDDHTLAQPIVAIQFRLPEVSTELSDDQFVLRDESIEATDLTFQYLSKLRPDTKSSLR